MTARAGAIKYVTSLSVRGLHAWPSGKTGRSSAWLERCVRDAEVACSNHVAPIFSVVGRKNREPSGESRKSRRRKSRSRVTALPLHRPSTRSPLYFLLSRRDLSGRSIAVLSPRFISRRIHYRPARLPCPWPLLACSLAFSNPVAPTIFRNEPFGENVEGLSFCRANSYVELSKG